ncbi:hypothetical protein Rs2_42297 [Raphanus sativus]|nr:hypothetical protein Rs2_42297 [Raphanus sativus]
MTSHISGIDRLSSSSPASLIFRRHHLTVTHHVYLPQLCCCAAVSVSKRLRISLNQVFGNDNEGDGKRIRSIWIRGVVIASLLLPSMLQSLWISRATVTFWLKLR